MSENEERAEATWSGDKFASGPLLIGEIAEQDPRKFVHLKDRGSCGAGGVFKFVVNSHPHRRIDVTVRTRWIYEGQQRSESRVFPLWPGAEEEVGCTIPGPTSQKFERDIVGAMFV